MTSKHQQSGFTLVEIAIVLVIIGLLLGGILKGQELIENSRVTNAVNDINGTKAAAYAYVDRYKQLPGDDAGAVAARGTSWGSVTAGNGNGVFGNTNQTPFGGTGEPIQFWQHLRAAGFVNGDPAASGVVALPKNAFGGLTGATRLTTQLNNMNSKVICLSQVPGKAAIAIDNRLDDGNPQTGAARAIAGAAGTNQAPGATAATAYSEDNTYTLCSAF